MRQLSSLDASFLFMEDSRLTGHVAGLLVLDPTSADKPIGVEAIKQHIGERLPLLPPMRWRLVEVPYGIELPYWYDDHDVDLDYHVRGITLPAPGDGQQLVEQIGRIHARPLHRAYPLWEVYVIDGLAGGKVGILSKFHHAAIDGNAGLRILSTVLSTDPRAVAPPPPKDLPPSESRPSEMEMLTRGYVSLLGYPSKHLELMVRGAVEWHQAMIKKFGNPVVGDLRSTIAQLIPPPRLSFNKSITSRRTVAFASVPLAAVKEVKNKQGCTINDVVMAMCAGAMRRWLIEHDELPEGPIRAMVPVAIRTAEQAAAAGNQVSAMFADLPTQLADPLARLDAIHSTMHKAKQEHAALPAELLQEFGQFTSPAASELVARTAATVKIADKLMWPFNLVISNVPGPRIPLYYAGALMEKHYPVSMIGDGMGLNITVHSYLDHLDFGVVSCPDLVPDVDLIVDHLRDELAALAAL